MKEGETKKKRNAAEGKRQREGREGADNVSQ